jgi:hypothetical protein
MPALRVGAACPPRADLIPEVQKFKPVAAEGALELKDVLDELSAKITEPALRTDSTRAPTRGQDRVFRMDDRQVRRRFPDPGRRRHARLEFASQLTCHIDELILR